MTKNDKTRMQQGLETLADCLNSKWFTMHHPLLDEETRKAEEANYSGMIQTLAVLGGDYLRDEKGNHRVFLAGMSSRGTDEFKEEG